MTRKELEKIFAKYLLEGLDDDESTEVLNQAGIQAVADIFLPIFEQFIPQAVNEEERKLLIEAVKTKAWIKRIGLPPGANVALVTKEVEFVTEILALCGQFKGIMFFLADRFDRFSPELGKHQWTEQKLRENADNMQKTIEWLTESQKTKVEFKISSDLIRAFDAVTNMLVCSVLGANTAGLIEKEINRCIDILDEIQEQYNSCFVFDSDSTDKKNPSKPN